MQHIGMAVQIRNFSIPPKTILLEEGKVAEKLYLIRKGCLRLFFYNEEKDIIFSNSFLRGILSPHSIAYTNTRRVFSIWRVSNQRNSRLYEERIFTF